MAIAKWTFCNDFLQDIDKVKWVEFAENRNDPRRMSTALSCKSFGANKVKIEERRL